MSFIHFFSAQSKYYVMKKEADVGGFCTFFASAQLWPKSFGYRLLTAAGRTFNNRALTGR
jgi:hypothetical protein